MFSLVWRTHPRSRTRWQQRGHTIEGSEAKVTTTKASIAGNELLTAKEVEELLRIHVKTVYSYAQRGLLPYVKIQSNLRFVKSEILKWMEEHQFKPTSSRGS